MMMLLVVEGLPMRLQLGSIVANGYK